MSAPTKKHDFYATKRYFTQAMQNIARFYCATAYGYTNSTKNTTFCGFAAASLQARTFLLDDERIFIGSLNLDPRSFNENTEIGLVIDNAEITSQVRQQITGN